MNKRIALWDNLRFFLILTVVLGHFCEAQSFYSYQRLFLFIYSFHMPALIFLSGLFHRNTQIKEKTAMFFSLYLIMKALIYLVQLSIGKSPSFHLFQEAGLPWFMWAMGIFVPLTYLLRGSRKAVVLTTALVLSCITGFFSFVGDRFVLSRTIVFFPFYYLGSFVSRDSLTSLKKNKLLVSLAFLILLSWFIFCFAFPELYHLRPFFTGRNPYGAQLRQWGWAVRMCCYLISSVLCFSWILVMPSAHFFWTVWGSRTLQVYFWHRVVLYYLSYFNISAVLCVTRVGKLLWLLLGICTAVLLSLHRISFPTEIARDFFLHSKHQIYY